MSLNSAWRRPNVGKSSLINAILGEDRVIASPVAIQIRDATMYTFYLKIDAKIFLRR